MKQNKVCIELFYDVISPYSYFLFNSLKRYQPIWQNELVLRPMLLGGLMKQVGNSPPLANRSKYNYVVQDVKLRAKLDKLPLSYPKTFPIPTISPMRLLAAVEMESTPEHLNALTKQLFEEFWIRNGDINDLQVLQNACEKIQPSISKETIEKWLELISNPQVKEKLKENTSEAAERGAFGAPTVFVTPNSNVPKKETATMFFGSDRLETIAAAFEL